MRMAYDGRLLAGVTVLMAVVEAGSMTRAADALGLTPSGVGRAIQRLEARIGVRLLDRTTRSLRLTDEGRRFCGRVGPLLDGVEEAALDAAGSVQRVRGRLRVNIDPFFSRLVLARELAAFLTDHPQLRLELNMRDHVRDLVADGFDMAVRFGDPPVGTFIVRKLLETRILKSRPQLTSSSTDALRIRATCSTINASTIRTLRPAGHSNGNSAGVRR
jgi:DNA-binding transcriptional LysR family regulator